MNFEALVFHVVFTQLNSLIVRLLADVQMSSIKRIVPRLTSMAFKMKFSELVTEIKPVSVRGLCMYITSCNIIAVYTLQWSSGNTPGDSCTSFYE